MRISYLFLSLLLFHFSSRAGVVTVSTAQTVAQHFYKSTTHSTTSPIATLNFTQTESDGTVDLYVFDISPAPGFVIVSATDQISPVLGYSTEVNYNGNISDIGITGWMAHTAASIHQAVVQNTPATQHISDLWTAYQNGSQIPVQRSAVVGPMLTTTWSQDPYSNLQCPYDNTNHGTSVTGCIATAMAQIMKFWSYPAHGTGSYSYVDSLSYPGYRYNIGRLSADFGATTYKWSQMPANLTDDNAAVATLMYQCGMSIGMNYSARGSSGYLYYPGNASAFNSFTAYFSYKSQTIQYVDKSNYTSASWQSMIENELNQGRPVLYSGQDTGNIGGHAWVCDGYDANGMLHMNWGWGGADNGFFATTDLNPGVENWSWSQAAIIGIEPDAAALSVSTVTEGLSLKVYPNPASSTLTISGNSTNTSAEYMVYDLTGHRITGGGMSGYSEVIDVSGYAPGIYIVKLQNGTQLTTHKFVVDR